MTMSVQEIYTILEFIWNLGTSIDACNIDQVIWNFDKLS